MPFLPLVRDAEHRTGKCNSGKRSQSCQGQRQTKKKKTPKHPAPPSGRVPRGGQGQLLVLPKPTAGHCSGSGHGWRGMEEAHSSRTGKTTGLWRTDSEGLSARGRKRRERHHCIPEEAMAGRAPVPDQIPTTRDPGARPESGRWP